MQSLHSQAYAWRPALLVLPNKSFFHYSFKRDSSSEVEFMLSSLSDDEIKDAVYTHFPQVQ